MKFLYSYFFPQTGESTVALANKDGVYLGTAKLHPDDKNFASEYAGCRLAQRRAWLQYLFKERRKNKLQLQTIRNLKQDILLNCNNIQQTDDIKAINRRINLKLRDYSNNIEALTENIKLLTKEIEKDIEIRDSLIKRTNIAKNTE